MPTVSGSPASFLGAERRRFPQMHTWIFAWETERYHISEISFHPEYGVPLRPGDEDAVRATDY